MDKFYEILEKKPTAKKNFRRRYNIFHGFCAGRANYEDPENGKLARDVRLPSPFPFKTFPLSSLPIRFFNLLLTFWVGVH